MSSPRPSPEQVPPTEPRSERRAKRRKLKTENDEREAKDEPEASASHGQAMIDATTFEGDFIAFLPSEDSLDEHEPVEHKRDKGKARETSPPVREWDRSKAKDGDDSHSKRKYDMVFDFNDGHANKKQRVDATSRKAPWFDRFDWENCKNVAEILHREVDAFTSWISPTPIEDEVRGLVVALIEKVVMLSFPDAQVFPFGSYETKLYLPLGDIDLVILSQSMAYSDRQTTLYALANTLKRSGITSKVTVIARAKVPIVKFVTTHGRFNVDISVNQQNGIISGSIINGFLKDMHSGGKMGNGSLALRSLVMITKAFLSQRSMNEVYTGGLGSYSVVCMAISFLQMHPKIRRGEIDPDKNLGVLLMDFFELYGCYFNYEEAGISLQNGGYYFKKKQRGWIDFQKGGLVSIEDPADTTNDISRGSFGFQRVRMALAGAHGILTSTAYLRAGVLNSRHHSRSSRLRDQYEAQDMSVLSSVMGVTQETINHRRLVQEVYDKRILHNMMGVAPKPIVVEGSSTMAVNGNPPRRRSRPSGARETVTSAWNVNDEDTNQNFLPVAVFDEEEEGRYHIGRRPPHKRRRMGRDADAHTVFTTDDGEDLSSEARSEVGDGEYHDGSHRRRPERTDETDRRRAYWLAKGVGISEAEEDNKGW